ncbi:MAG: PorV/PorQ family protein [Candidatus Marinimicrobia bacterium]|nr:PorV/PorQ family protein [Candidatus Neomarinimicrobiota bacterium]
MKLIQMFILQLVIVINIGAQNTTARFLLWHPSARSISLGGCGVALIDNNFSTFYNPSGLAFSKGINIVSSYGKPYPFFDNTQHLYSTISMPFVFGALGISINQIWREPQQNNLMKLFGNDKGVFNPLHWQVKLSFATLLKHNVAFGLNLNLLRIKLSKFGAGSEKGLGQSTTALFDFGFLIRNLLTGATLISEQSQSSAFLNRFRKRIETKGLAVGLALSNAGQKIMFIDGDQKDRPPTMITLGLAYYPIVLINSSLLLTIDFEKQVFETSNLDYIHIGNEIGFLNILTFRSGYFLDTDKPFTSYFSWGAGINLKFISLNFVRYEMSLAPTWHFDASINFGPKS